MHALYLHGLASSPASAKATFFEAKLSKLGITFKIPDLNLPTFETLSFGAILNAASMQLNTLLPEPTIILGSSLGALAALHMVSSRGSESPQPSALILLAPAFDFRHNKKLTPDTLALWEKAGKIPVHHSATGAERELPFTFLQELEILPPLNPPSVPTLIIHGRNDEVIGIEHSREFSRISPMCQLLEVSSDHQMLSAFDVMLPAVIEFLRTI